MIEGFEELHQQSSKREFKTKLRIELFFNGSQFSVYFFFVGFRPYLRGLLSLYSLGGLANGLGGRYRLGSLITCTVAGPEG